MGRGRDRDGQPIVGASVRIEACLWSQGGWEIAAWTRQLARRLPEVRTARDGTFVLPLLPEQRVLSMIGLAWSVVVEKSGYQTWQEYLPSALYGYLGSAVELRELDPADEVEFVAEGAPAGFGVVVHDRLARRFVALDGAGRARVNLPRIPLPLQAPWNGMRPLGWFVSSRVPGWSSPVELVRPVHRLEPEGTAQLTEITRMLRVRTAFGTGDRLRRAGTAARASPATGAFADLIAVDADTERRSLRSGTWATVASAANCAERRR